MTHLNQYTYTLNSRRYVSIEADSLEHVLQARPLCEENRAAQQSLLWNQSFILNSDPYWLGGVSSAEIIRRVQEGWPEGLELVAPMIEQIANKEFGHFFQSVAPIRRRKRRKHDQGDEVDIHKIYQGRLDTAWTRTERLPKSEVGKTVSVFIDASGLASVDFERALWRAACAIHVVDELIKAGRSVRVSVGSTAHSIDNGSAATLTCVRVKDYNQPLNMDRLVAMSTLGFHRVINFAMRASGNWRSSRTSMGTTLDQYRLLPYSMLKDELELGTSVVRIGQARSLREAKIVMSRVAQQLETGGEFERIKREDEVDTQRIECFGSPIQD